MTERVTQPMRFFVCTMARGTDWLEGAALILARSSDEAAAVFPEYEAVAPLNTYEITGVGMMSNIVGRLGKVGEVDGT